MAADVERPRVALARAGSLDRIQGGQRWAMTTEFRRTAFGQRILDHARCDRAQREGRNARMASPMFEAWTDGVFPALAKDAE